MSFQKVVSVVVGVGAIIARACSAYSHTETPREKRHYDDLLEQTWRSVTLGLNNENHPLSATLVPATSMMLYAFVRISPEEIVALDNLPAPREVRLEEKKSFKEQLASIDFNMDELPEKFLDPITMELMEEPVKAITSLPGRDGIEQRKEHIYDKTTFNKFNGECPENRQPFLEVKDHSELKNEIETFVKNKVTQKRSAASNLRH